MQDHHLIWSVQKDVIEEWAEITSDLCQKFNKKIPSQRERSYLSTKKTLLIANHWILLVASNFVLSNYFVCLLVINKLL